MVTPEGTVANSVRQAMISGGVLESDIVRLLGVSHDWLDKRLSGESSFHADQLIAIARFLGIRPSRFFASADEGLAQEAGVAS